MNLLENISTMFSVDVKQGPANTEEIDRLRKFSSISVPDDYINVVKYATEVEIKVNNHSYIRIWSPLGCIEMNEAYNVQSFIPNSLAIGDDEGGRVLIYVAEGDSIGLYLVGFGDLDFEDAIWVAPSLHDLLVNNVGIALF